MHYISRFYYCKHLATASFVGHSAVALKIHMAVEASSEDLGVFPQSLLARLKSHGLYVRDTDQRHMG